MQKIIVTADDYGMCDIVDEAIDAGIQNGMITSTNVMLNMESLKNAKSLRTRFPNISIGIHWNVTTGKPISDPCEIPTLVDEKGYFWPITEFKRRFEKKLISYSDLEKELEAQYDLFYQFCGHPDYWNSHENSSLNIKTYKVFEKVATNHNIIATRTFQRVYYDKINLGFKKTLREFLVKNFFEIWFTRIRKKFVMPTARVVSFDKISKTSEDVLLKALLDDGRDYIEVIFHPAINCESQYFGNISIERVKEFNFLSSKKTYQLYVDKGIKFVNFDNLKD